MATDGRLRNPPETWKGNREMAVNASSLFNRDELSYRKMLDDGGILVCDRWFDKDSSEIERTRYRMSCLRRQDRNRRRRDRRHAKVAETGVRKRNPPVRIPVDPESQRKHRMPLERRKCSRRSTIAECPTANEIRTAWHYRNRSPMNRVRLGALLMDLECHVDNSLITIVERGLLKIVGRHGGLKDWIRGNCPELEAHYKTLQRIKGMAKLVRQRLDVLDPMPLSALLDARVTDEDVSNAEVHVQPRSDCDKPVVNRFAWELSPPVVDADGRTYFHNANYEYVRFEIPSSVRGHLAGFRSVLRSAISLIGAEKRTNETYSGEAAEGGDFGGAIGRWKEFFAYAGRHPEFLAEAGADLVRDVARGAREGFLPERTNRRIRDGEKVGVGRLALDIADAYYRNIYVPSLIYRWR